MSSEKPLEILVVGAGVAGAALALLLSQQPGLEPKPNITIVERAAMPRSAGQAIDIRGRAVDIIRKLGLEQKIQERHTTETGLQFVDSKGKQIARFDASGDSDSQNATSEYEILRSELVDLLISEVHECGNVSVVYGTSVQAIKQNNESVVEVQFDTDKIPRHKYDLLVAGDGMLSKTRAMIFEGDQEYDRASCVYPLGQYTAYFSVPRQENDAPLWQWYGTAPGLMCSLRPHRNKETMGAYLAITLPKRESNAELDAAIARGPDQQKALLRERFQGVGWQADRILDEMDKASDFYFTQIAQVKLHSWIRGRCVLLGDAAHAPSPMTGLGTSLAITGAYILSGELSQRPVPEATKRFQEIWKPAADSLQYVPPGVPQLFLPQTKFGTKVMQTCLKVASATGFTKILSSLGERKDDKWPSPDYGWA